MKTIITHKSKSGKSYKLDLKQVTCTCPDFKWSHREQDDIDDPHRLCKHLKLHESEIIEASQPKQKKGWSRKGRHLRSDAQKIVDIVGRMIVDYGPGLEFEVCGSYRREKETIGDLDFIIKGEYESYLKFLKKLTPISDKVLTQGEQKCSILFGGIQVDLRYVEPEHWVFMLMHSTGSKEENIRLRRKALQFKCTLNEYGLWDEDGNCFPVCCEQDVYDILEEKFKEPNQR